MTGTTPQEGAPDMIYVDTSLPFKGCTNVSTIQLGGDWQKIETQYIRLDLFTAMQQERDNLIKARDSYPRLKCGHDGYWKTHYGNCMACYHEIASAQRNAMQQERDAKTRELDHAWNVAKQAHDSAQKRIAELGASIYTAWCIIANASNGDWSKQSAEWVGAAERWRDTDYQPLDGRKGGDG